MPRHPHHHVETTEWDLPTHRATLNFEGEEAFLSQKDLPMDFYDAKFYPYNPPGAAPILAIISKTHVIVCRVGEARDSPIEIIRLFRSEKLNGDIKGQEDANIACCWALDAETQRPLLCVAGNDANITVHDVVAGTVVKTLVGHGSGINDLATSPTNPHIIASASEDTTVRIWSLSPIHEKQPCVVLLGGEGHSWDLLSVAFHDNGRYILSSGHDQVINLWTLPDIPQEHIHNPLVVHYPHFSTCAIHSGSVDCVAFLGDNILSRAAFEDTIVLWRIEGFNSEDPPPLPSEAPTTYDPKQNTRSAFGPEPSSSYPAQYTRLLEFGAAGCLNNFFLRFQVFQAPGQHAVLAFGNAKNKMYFWDLERLTAYHEFKAHVMNPDRDKSKPIERPSWLQLKGGPRKNDKKGKGIEEGSTISMASTPVPVSADMDASGIGTDMATVLGVHPEIVQNWESMYSMNYSHNHPLKPHRTIVLNEKQNYKANQAAWSPEGDWCVVVGDYNRACFFQRWPKQKRRPVST